jgi:hypothetical protein
LIVNGKPAPSYLTKVTDLDQVEAANIDGFGMPQNPDLIRKAFALAGRKRR